MIKTLIYTIEVSLFFLMQDMQGCMNLTAGFYFGNKEVLAKHAKKQRFIFL